MSKKKLDVLVVGCGNMGASHAKAYHRLDEFNIVGLVSRGPESREKLNEELGGGIALFGDFHEALKETSPDAVSISTYPTTHAEYTLASLEAGAHVFVEKPISETVEEAEKIAATAKRMDKKVVVGYILRHHPGWKIFVDRAQTLGSPLVMRMNLNQQSTGDDWRVHKSIMESMSPIVDCGVHYVDMMCQMTGSRPKHVHAIGARLADGLNPGMYNYGQLQVVFDDGSVGWYESGWGPMMSEQAFVIKDVIGPKGSISILKEGLDNQPRGASANVEDHVTVERLRYHPADVDGDELLTKEDEIIEAPKEADHDELCFYEQEFFLKAIQEDLDLTDHLNDVVNTLKIVLAADESFRTGQVVEL